jgi:hypothetical protein
MRHFVQNNGLEKSDEVELGYYDYGQLYMPMSTVRKNSAITRLGLRHSIFGIVSVQDAKNEALCATERVKHLTQLTMPYMSVTGKAARFP